MKTHHEQHNHGGGNNVRALTPGIPHVDSDQGYIPMGPNNKMLAGGQASGSSVQTRSTDLGGSSTKHSGDLGNVASGSVKVSK